MRRFALSAVVLLVLAVAVGSASAAPAPAVPRFIQGLVESKAGALAYAPTRLPFRYRYVGYGWDPATQVLKLRFADSRFPLDGRHTIVFSAQRFGGALSACAVGKQKTLQMGGNRVYSDGSVAWRCVRGSGGRNVRVEASGPNLPDVALGRVVASVKRL